MLRDGKTVGAVITSSTSPSEKKRMSTPEERAKEVSLLEIKQCHLNNLTQEALFGSAYEAILASSPSTGLPSSSPAGETKT